jgi:hypothetical protein
MELVPWTTQPDIHPLGDQFRIREYQAVLSLSCSRAALQCLHLCCCAAVLLCFYVV